MSARHDPVEVCPHDPNWAVAFEEEAAVLRAALAPMEIALHHIGSTSVPGLLAKPIIDLMGAVADLGALDTRSADMERLGYEVMGAFGIEGRRYFRKITPAGRRTHHLHIYTHGSPHLTRHLAFRDYLRAHTEIAQAYSNLKTALTARPDATWDSYIDGKDAFVQETERAALVWWKSRMS